MNNRTKSPAFSVLIPDGDEANALSVVRCLAEVKNIQVFVISEHKYAPIRFSRYVKKFIHLPFGDNENYLAGIIEAIKKTKADVLLPVGVRAVRLIIEKKETFAKVIANINTPEIHSFDIADDKWLLSRWLKENNIAHPETLLFSPGDNLEEVISKISFPIIVKPRVGWGGKGIEIFENNDQFEEWYSGFDHKMDLIVQDYIKGYDIDCSLLGKQGEILAYTIQRSIKYSADYPWPYGLEFKNQEEILAIVEDLVEKFNWSGIVHIDLRYDEVEKRANLIEMNPRFWASVTASIFAGVNFPYLACLTALGEELPIIKLEDKIVVRSGPAVKMTWKRIVKNQKNLNFDNSFLEFIAKDPLPTIIGETLEYYQNFRNR
ncbi:carboxylate--amine ligase [Algoriphagus halophilus]|uniref:Predicted ATP-dependent carboligase, ATP-grasp superfamily n=1 Tax=Algoriphagus halophilus TaxID=226505 RepID=A0A1N6DF65_9BACT|nr:ATP-grasp domain-containing protein [Algoriphagus halophilus]SIN69449.1 Predicted ATP-dependent carboligase, ATP-grasp superfamily [Algoriphagus halophilus]